MAASSVSPEKGPEEICYYKPLPQEPMGRWRIWRICERLSGDAGAETGAAVGDRLRFGVVGVPRETPWARSALGRWGENAEMPKSTACRVLRWILNQGNLWYFATQVVNTFELAMGFTCLLVGIEEELPGLETLQDLLTKHAARLERKSGQHKARVFCNGSQILHFGQRKLMEIVLKSTPFWCLCFRWLKAPVFDSETLESSLHRLLSNLRVWPSAGETSWPKPKEGVCHLESNLVCLVDAFGPRWCWFYEMIWRKRDFSMPSYMPWKLWSGS